MQITQTLLILMIILSFDAIKAFLIGDQCKYDDDCIVDHSFCEVQEICECKNNFIGSSDGETCIALVGAHCHSKYDCSSLSNSICVEDRCVCEQGYVSNVEENKCLPIILNIKETCENDSQCKARLGQETHCFNKQCHCFPGYHFEKKCITSKRLGEECKNDYDCFLGEIHRGSVVCSRGNCWCARGFHQESNLCLDNGSSNKKKGIQVLTIISIIIYLIWN